MYHMASYGMSGREQVRLCLSHGIIRRNSGREQVRLCVSHGVIQNVWQRTGKIVIITWRHKECLAENKVDCVYHMASYGMSGREQVRLCVSHGVIRNVWQRTGKIVFITWRYMECLVENR